VRNAVVGYARQLQKSHKSYSDIVLVGSMALYLSDVESASAVEIESYLLSTVIDARAAYCRNSDKRFVNLRSRRV